MIFLRQKAVPSGVIMIVLNLLVERNRCQMQRYFSIMIAAIWRGLCMTYNYSYTDNYGKCYKSI